jgi:hypothetical protein
MGGTIAEVCAKPGFKPRPLHDSKGLFWRFLKIRWIEENEVNERRPGFQEETSLPLVYVHASSGSGSGSGTVDSVPLSLSIRAISATSRVATPRKSGVFTLEMTHSTPGWEQTDKKLRGPVPRCQ